MFIGLLFVGASPALSFDVNHKNQSFVGTRYVTFGIGVGMTGFARQQGIQGDPGFGLRITAGHQFNRYFDAELFYQFSTFRFDSPDSINPASSLNTRAVSYPLAFIQPFVSAGIGGYNLVDINRETALSFPFDFELPLAAGVRTYLLRNLISLDVEFTYHLLFGTNQSVDTLALLGLSKLEFDTYSALVSVTFHMF